MPKLHTIRYLSRNIVQSLTVIPCLGRHSTTNSATKNSYNSSSSKFSAKNWWFGWCLQAGFGLHFAEHLMVCLRVQRHLYSGSKLLVLNCPKSRCAIKKLITHPLWGTGGPIISGSDMTQEYRWKRWIQQFITCNKCAFSTDNGSVRWSKMIRLRHRYMCT